MNEKSNEIVAIPARDHRRHRLPTRHRKKIIDKKADYILALKGNQQTLREDVEVFAIEQKAKGFEDTTVSRHEMVIMAASKRGALYGDR